MCPKYFVLIRKIHAEAQDYSWTMRQESKLSFVKRISRQSNFKNICKTVAKKTPFLDVLPVTKWPESTQTISHLQHEI